MATDGRTEVLEMSVAMGRDDRQRDIKIQIHIKTPLLFFFISFYLYTFHERQTILYNIFYPRGDIVMNDFIHMAKEREDFLFDLMLAKEQALKNVPEGSLRANRCRDKTQFYQRTEKTGGNGRYLKKGEEALIHALAQKEYDQKILTASECEWKLLRRLNKIYESKERAEDQFDKIPLGKQPEINPIRLSDQLFVKKWEAEPYASLGFTDQTAAYFSDKNERMRSKSEIIIANMLNKYGVPYRYECPLNLGGKEIYPDFTVLNVRLRKEYYWEHLGLLENPEYQHKNLSKIVLYEMNGYFPGDSLIITFETSKQPLNMILLERIIQKYFL